ncbi:MAG: carboxypeptidase regulatory-like domain-containing protein [Fidelibacterota bacterium]
MKQVRMLQALEKFKAEFNQHRSQSLNPDQKQMNAKKPNLPNTPGFFAHHGSRQATRDVNRQLIFGSGRLSTHPDSLYFHFFSGMNGSDTTGMDVILSGNEGANFGNEAMFGTAFTDPSLLYYLSPDSSMYAVQTVPSVTDTAVNWTEISWDWSGGNNFQPVVAGNIWVIYTRTTHDYVVMEVTNSSGLNWGSPWIEFDYLYQDDGSTTFNSDSTGSAIDIVINGMDDANILQGDPFTVTVYFSPGEISAEIGVWIDGNGNGVFDTLDYDLGDYSQIFDNSAEDENPAPGVYQYTVDNFNDGPNHVSNLQIYYTAADNGGWDVASLSIDPMITAYSFSGHIEPAQANLIVFAFDMNENNPEASPWMTVTDGAGNYQNYLPYAGTWSLLAFDFIGVLDGMAPDTAYFDIPVVGHETGYDFNFFTPTSGMEGIVSDENGYPLDSVLVWVSGDGPGYSTETDQAGYFFFSLVDGEWWLSLDDMELVPDYLVPTDTLVYVPEDDTTWVEITAYSTDATISGTVYLDNMPWSGPHVKAWSEIGWTRSPIGPNGQYELHVFSGADQFGGYFLSIPQHQLPPNVTITYMPQNVMSGTSSADIYLISVSGGLEGQVFNASDGSPVPYAWVHATNDMFGQGVGTDANGNYYLPLPNGDYTVDVGADGYFSQHFEHVIIQDNILAMDFFLNEFTVGGIISGYVYDDETGAGIVDAHVMIGNDFFWNDTWTDMNGYYEFEVPNGVYSMVVEAENYIQSYVEGITVQDNDVSQDFYLTPIVLNAVIEGLVVDMMTGGPVIGAEVYAMGMYYQTMTMSTTDGYFYMDVPSDSFYVWAQAPGFGYSDPIPVFVAADDTAYVVLELHPPTVNPPQILGVFDVPMDQGKQVHIVWLPGSNNSDFPIIEFSIWRLLPYAEIPLWDYVATVPFHGMEPYSTVVPTLVDSNMYTGPTGDFWSIFRVTAHTMNPWEFYDSEPAAGYSIDNLFPHVPGNLTAILGDNHDEVQLSWRPVTDLDFQYYTVYRSTAPGVDLSTPYAFTTDTAFVDTDISPGSQFYYLITATDFSGNEGDPSEEATVVILANDEDGYTPTTFALSQNYPNPFNPVTTFTYDLPHDGFVSIIVYNVLGEKVDELVNQNQSAGRYTVTWNGYNHPSGVYVARMQTEGFTTTRKIMLLK